MLIFFMPCRRKQAEQEEELRRKEKVKWVGGFSKSLLEFRDCLKERERMASLDMKFSDLTSTPDVAVNGSTRGKKVSLC